MDSAVLIINYTFKTAIGDGLSAIIFYMGSVNYGNQFQFNPNIMDVLRKIELE